MKRNAELDHTVETASLDENGFNKYCQIFDANNMPRNDGELEWRYQNNPSKESSMICFAIHDECQDIAAVYATMGVTFLFDGARVPGVQSLDTLTDKNHRRKGLFPFLANRTYERLVEAECLAVYGFPNENSFKVFDKHLGWDVYGSVDFLVRPLRTGYFIKQLLRRFGWDYAPSWLDIQLPVRKPRVQNLTFKEVNLFTGAHEKIWRETSLVIRIAIDRSADYLNWRIFGRPDGSKYRVLEAVNSVGEIEGFVVWTVEEKHGGQIGYLMECLVLPGRYDTQRSLINKAVYEMAARHADVILAWGLPDHEGTKAMRKSGFFRLPERLRPTQLYWGCRLFNSAVEVNPTDWYISYLDSDTV